MKLVLLAFFCLSGCASVNAAEENTAAEPTPVPTPMTLRVCVGAEGSSIDPAYVAEINPGDYMGHLFEGLMRYVPADTGETVSELEVVPGLAESVEVSGDGLTYRFVLRADAAWSDGRAVTAGDFVYAWQRLLNVGQSPGAGVLREVLASCHAEDARVLVVQLQRVCPWFLRLCAAYYMVPLREDIIARYGGDWTDEGNIVVSGPYMLQQWVHDDVMVLVPNPCYYDRARLGPQMLEWRFDTETSAQFTGEEAMLGTDFLYFNTASIRDWRVRAAMVLAVDREALGMPAEGLVPGDASPLYDWLGARYSRYDITTLEGRRELARDLMDIARVSGSWYSSYKVYIRVAEQSGQFGIAKQCAADWREVLGLQAEIVETPAGEYGAILTGIRFDVACARLQPAYDDPMAYLQMMERGGAENHTAWGDVRYDALLERAEETMDAAERKRLLQEAEGFLFGEDGFAVCPLLWPAAQYEGKNVTGVGYGAGEWRFQYACAG